MQLTTNVRAALAQEVFASAKRTRSVVRTKNASAKIVTEVCSEKMREGKRERKRRTKTH